METGIMVSSFQTKNPNVTKQGELRRAEHYGRRFGLLVVTGSFHNGRRWLLRCQCDCGKVADVLLCNLIGSGDDRSCGCVRDKKTSEYFTTHGMRHHRLYHVWSSMRQRCNSPTCHAYKNYGARGIKMAPAWSNFAVFYAYILSLLPAGETDVPNGLSIDRIDNDRGYEPGNIRFADLVTQQRNKRDSVIVEIDGVKRCLKEWCEVYGVNYKRTHSRVRKGMPAIEALSIRHRLSTGPKKVRAQE